MGFWVRETDWKVRSTLVRGGGWGAAVPGIAGVWAWTSGARRTIAAEMDSLSGGSVPDDVVLYGTADGARLPRYEVSKKG